MSNSPPTCVPLYVWRILDSARAGLAPTGKLALVEVRHDPSCTFVCRHGACDCIPDVQFRYDVAADEELPRTGEHNRR
jgi:hypothetical protein